MTKEEIEHYLKNTELDVQRANASFLFVETVYSSYVESDAVHGILFSPVFCYFSGERKGDFYQFCAKNIFSSVAKKIYEDYTKNPESLDQKISEHIKIEQQIENIWIGYLSKRQTLNREKFSQLFEDFVRLMKKWWNYAAIGEDKGSIIHDVITPKFAVRHSLDFFEADQLVNILSHPTTQTVVIAERKHFLEICLDIYHDKKVDQKLDYYLQKYFWIKSDFYQAREISSQSVRIEAEEEIKSRKITEIEEELNNIVNNFERLSAQKQNLPSSFVLTAQDELDLRFAQKIIEWMDVRKTGMMKIFYFLSKIIEDLSVSVGINYDILVSYSADEVIKLLKTKERISDKELSDRTSGLFMEFEKNENRGDFFGQEALELFQTATAYKTSDEIRGQVASKGSESKVTGTARIVVNPSKDEFNSGEVLVTSMTRVEFVPLMRRAKEIITDEGGIASHAAIISRELHKPCIIGTKNATKILKDDDLVEVDADTGIVRIIRKA